MPEVSMKITFDVSDLFEDEGYRLGKFNPKMNLNLRVNPSGGSE